MKESSAKQVNSDETTYHCSQEHILAAQSKELKVQARSMKRNHVLLTRLSKVTLGNGHEEDGILFIVRKFVKEQDVIIDDIRAIKDKLSTVTEINTELEIQRRVRVEKEKLLAEIKEEDDLKLRKKSFNLGKVPVVVGVLSLLTLMLFSILNYNISKRTKLDTAAIKTETEITNDALIPPGKTRGQYYDPFAKDTLSHNGIK